MSAGAGRKLWISDKTSVGAGATAQLVLGPLPTPAVLRSVLLGSSLTGASAVTLGWRISRVSTASPSADQLRDGLIFPVLTQTTGNDWAWVPAGAYISTTIPIGARIDGAPAYIALEIKNVSGAGATAVVLIEWEPIGGQ